MSQKDRKYKITTAFRKIAKLQNKVRVIQGGKGASKTISILEWFILRAMGQEENLIFSVVALSLPNLKSGAMRDFERILKDWDLWDKIQHNKTDRIYTFPNGSIIEFFPVDTESARLGSRREYLYMNESDKLSLDVYLEVYGRTNRVVFIDYNPRRTFWVHTEVIGQPGVDFLRLSYLDNEYLPEGEKESLLFIKRKADETGSKYWINKWKVLGLGELGITDGLIFEEDRDYKIVDKIPESARYLGAGLDFGFTHPTTIVKLYVEGEKVYLKQALFQSGMTAPAIIQFIINDPELMGSVIVADSARPEMIKEMQTSGVPVLSHKKGAVQFGLDLMRSKELYVTADSEEMLEELRSYAWKTDKTGKSLGVPDKSADSDNAIDAARYVIEHFLSKQVQRTNRLRWLY